MSSFVRRFLFDPGIDVLLEIESVNVLDLEPPSSITGVGTGLVSHVAEMEDGPFNTPTEVTSANDLVSVFGGFGYTVAGVSSQNPCAVSRQADSAVAKEYWNGNGTVQLNGKKFRRLVITRADTSVGSVRFNRLAFLTGLANFRYNLDTGDVFSLKIDGAGAVTTTFLGTKATVTAVAGAYPSGFVGGETLVLGYDDATNFTTTFLAADQSLAQVVSRINSYAGYTFVDTSGGQIRLTGRQGGTGGAVRVVSGSAGVLVALGLTAATTAGTGNTVNIDAVTVAEINTAVLAATTNKVTVLQDANGALRAVNVYTPDTGTLECTASPAAFGFPTSVVATAVTGVNGFLPAGTRVRVPSGQQFVTMQTLAITAGSSGPYDVKVRHATDNGTGLAATAGTITSLQDVPDVGSFSVINLLPTSAALTEAQIDVAYTTAFDSTINLNSVAKEINIQYCARQSNTVRRTLKENAKTASASGHLGRKAIMRPPMGTTKAQARSTTAEPGVGAYRDQRVIYCFPQARTFVPGIARLGLTGGAGFSADGIVDAGADGFLAGIMSQLPPEENPGQDTPFMDGCIDVESSANAHGFQLQDYINFKASGIASLRFDGGAASFQSGVTSVDPVLNPSLVNIARRSMADYIQDSLSLRLKAFGKKLNFKARRTAIATEIRNFLELLKNPPGGNPRIDDYSVDIKTGNTPELLARGMYRIIIKVRTLSSLDSIVLQTTIGEQVIVAEAALPSRPQPGLR